jgi:hypothetical protein
MEIMNDEYRFFEWKYLFNLVPKKKEHAVAPDRRKNAIRQVLCLAGQRTGRCFPRPDTFISVYPGEWMI